MEAILRVSLPRSGAKRIQGTVLGASNKRAGKIWQWRYIRLFTAESKNGKV